jgi:hypothetical protein
MTDALKQRLRDAAPITDDQVRALTLDVPEADLFAAITAQPRAARARRPRHRSRRWALPGLGTAAVAGAAVLIVSLAGGGAGGKLSPAPERAWAASAVRVANAVPRLLIGEPDWRVTRADEFTVDEGEMTFSNGSATLDLHWRTGSFRTWVADRAHSGDALPAIEVLGTRAKVFRYRDSTDDFTALWRSGRLTMELRSGYPTRLSEEEYRRVLGSLKVVGVDQWLAAMPPSVVLPAETTRAVDAMLAGIPLPDGFNADALKRDAAVRDRYQLGARVAGAVACGWIEQWTAARRAGDREAAAAAVEAMQTSRRWPILREMQAEGEYPDLLWELADAMRDDSSIPAGRRMSVDDGYEAALGC